MKEKIELQNEGEFHVLKMHPLVIAVVFVFGIIAVFDGISSIIGLIIGSLCGYYAAKHWAPKFNGSQTWAFVIPYIFGIIGFFLYWIHYRFMLKHVKKPTDTVLPDGG